jgi:hypothetical protein
MQTIRLRYWIELIQYRDSWGWKPLPELQNCPRHVRRNFASREAAISDAASEYGRQYGDVDASGEFMERCTCHRASKIPVLRGRCRRVVRSPRGLGG